jgi:hypothetical protein
MVRGMCDYLICPHANVKNDNFYIGFFSFGKSINKTSTGNSTTDNGKRRQFSILLVYF